MTSLNEQSIVGGVTEFYFESGDFNGYPLYRLKLDLELSDLEVKQLLHSLITKQHVDVVFGNLHPNPHIKPYGDVSVERQLEYLSKIELHDHICLYPSRLILASCDRVKGFEGSPYTKALALGSGQFDFRAFDLSILEFYRNDPRYHYWTDWINGNIEMQGEYFEADSTPEPDKIGLQTFGFAYSETFDRAVAVFLRYLRDLTPEHQRLWEVKELTGKYNLHPDYYRNCILGEFGGRVSIFHAFVRELSIINKMAEAMGRPPLFRETFADQNLKGFGFLVRPTHAEYNSFAHLLDKMLSENLNKDFFRDDIPLEEENVRGDGKIVVTQINTIRLLEQFLNKYFRPENPLLLQQMIKTLRRIRQLRQKPAHAINDDKFDQKYFHEQRKLMIEAYDSIRTLRLIFADHPKVRENPPEIEPHIFDGKIWTI